MALALALAEAERLATSLSLSCDATPRHACVQNPGKRLDELEMDGSGDEMRFGNENGGGNGNGNGMRM